MNNDMSNDIAELEEKLRKFRDELPKEQRRTFNALVGGAVAALKPFRKVAPPTESESLAQKLMKFRDKLPPQQGEAVTAMIAASGMAWAVAADREIKDGGKGGGEDVIYYWIEVAKCVAGLIIAGTLIYDILDEDDVEPDVPDLHFPDPSGGFPS